MDAPRTIDDAELLGWQALDAYCPSCRRTTTIPWPMIRRTTTRRHLADIASRLRCERCGTAPERVSLSALMTWGGTGAPAIVQSDILIRPPYQPPPARRPA